MEPWWEKEGGGKEEDMLYLFLIFLYLYLFFYYKRAGKV
jgi:hypothetical protein